MNNLRIYNNINTPDSQEGATLIVVLLFLVLISIAGVISVKRSSLDLRVATSDQINTVLLQSSDSVNSKFEEAANSVATPRDEAGVAQDTRRYDGLFRQKTGMFNHFISNESYSENVVDFCFLPKDISFSVKDAVVRLNDGDGGSLYNASEGFCNPSVADHYTSSRATTMTQVTLDQVPPDIAYADPANTNPDDFAIKVTGIDSDNTEAQKGQYDIFSTSMLPAYGSARSSEVRNCLSSKDPRLPITDSESLQKCLIDQDIASKTVVERVEIDYLQRVSFCTLHGGAAVNPLPSYCR